MHELSICLALLDQVSSVAREVGAESVRSISIQVGLLSGVDAGLLARAFDVACLGGVSEGAKLVVSTIPVRIRCGSCCVESEVPPNRLLCGACGGHKTKVTQGAELTLREIEMDVPADLMSEPISAVAS